MNFSYDYLPTAEVAQMLKERLERLELGTGMVDLRAGKAPGTTRRVLRCDYQLCRLDIAERLLDAVGLDVRDCPTYEVIDDFNAAIRSKYHKRARKHAPSNYGSGRREYIATRLAQTEGMTMDEIISTYWRSNGSRSEAEGTGQGARADGAPAGHRGADQGAGVEQGAARRGDHCIA